MPPVDSSAAGPRSGKDAPVETATKRNKPRYHAFTQQQLPACKPILAPHMVIPVLAFVGLVFIPIGLACIAISNKVVEVVYRYDTKCVPGNMLHNKVAYIQNASIDKTCTIVLKVPKDMKRPIFIYYQLDKFYQNHRRYTTSRSDVQLRDPKQAAANTELCKPEAYAGNGSPIVPCGLVAWSLFNDTYSFAHRRRRGGHAEALTVIKSGISWRSDRGALFGKQVYPKNFQNGSLVGGGQLDPTKPLSEQEDLMVWMRTAALPRFRKLYGRVEADLGGGELLAVEVRNNYNSYSFSGRKAVVLSTAGPLGGRNTFLGRAYVVAGVACFALALILTLLCVAFPISLWSHRDVESPGRPSWLSDRGHLFGKQVYPKNFQNGSLLGGGHLDPTKPLSEQEDLMVWMRTAALPRFMKLYGRVEADLGAGELLAVEVRNNYNSYSYSGRKAVVLSTAGPLGGRNTFLGSAYVVAGVACFALALILTLLCLVFPMKEEHLLLR